MIKFKSQAISNLRPKAVWGLYGDTLEWLDTEQTEPTKAEIDAEIKRLQTEQDALAYQELRRSEYNKLNQDEMRFDDLINSTTTWVDSIKAIKAKYPKGTK
jgi:uncharacterized protein YifE (UPF0438 family)